MQAALWKGPQAKECGQPLEAGKVKATDCPLEAPQRSSSTNMLTFSPLKPKTPVLQNCEMINKCGFIHFLQIILK